MTADEDLLELWNNLPVGMIEFELDGSILVMNAMVSQWLVPHLGTDCFDNAYPLLAPFLPDLETTLLGDDLDSDETLGTATFHLPGRSPQTLFASITKSLDRYVAVISDITAQSRLTA